MNLFFFFSVMAWTSTNHKSTHYGHTEMKKQLNKVAISVLCAHKSKPFNLKQNESLKSDVR